MKFSKTYEPNEYEPDVYALWEKSGAFIPNNNKKAENYTIVMPPPNANGNLHIGHGLTIALEDILTRYHRLKGDNTWYIPGADHAGFETWVVYERYLESQGKSRFDYTRDELYTQVWNFVHEQRGNMELQLDRTLANKRIFPAVNLIASSTRRDDLLQDDNTRRRMWIIRNHIADMTNLEAMDTILKHIERTESNEEFLATMNG